MRDLPPCRFRGAVFGSDGGRAECRSPRVVPGLDGRVPETLCLRCIQRESADAPRAEMPPIHAIPAADAWAVLPCRHRGERLGEVPCGRCGDRERLVPLHACGLHGKCVVSRTGRGSGGDWPACTTCRDREDETG